MDWDAPLAPLVGVRDIDTETRWCVAEEEVENILAGTVEASLFKGKAAPVTPGLHRRSSRKHDYIHTLVLHPAPTRSPL